MGNGFRAEKRGANGGAFHSGQVLVDIEFDEAVHPEFPSLRLEPACLKRRPRLVEKEIAAIFRRVRVPPKAGYSRGPVCLMDFPPLSAREKREAKG